jgi:hypothetical protein
VGLRTVIALEAGERDATTGVLTRLLHACGLRLDVTPAAPEAPPCLHLVAHLQLSLTARWVRAVHSSHPRHHPAGGAAVDRALQAAAEVGDLELEAAASVAVWVPGAPVTTPLLVVAHVPRRVLQKSVERLAVIGTRHVALRQVQQALPSGLVPVRLRTGADLHVLPPGVLARQHACRAWRPALLAAAALLDDRAPRDAAGRRVPAHRLPDEDEEARGLSHHLAWTFRGAARSHGQPHAPAGRRRQPGSVDPAQRVRGSLPWPDS